MLIGTYISISEACFSCDDKQVEQEWEDMRRSGGGAAGHLLTSAR